MTLSLSGIGSWIQEGWLAGAAGQTVTPSGQIDLYEEGMPSDGSNYYKMRDIGGLNFNSSIQLRIEYYANSGETDCPGISGVTGMGPWSGPCWKSYYNGAFEAQWNSGGSGYNSYSNSGGAAVGGETMQNNNYPDGDPQVEMPTTVYGSASPNSQNGLQIKSANGYVVWNTSLPSDYTSEYDERYCASGTDGPCPKSPPYAVSNFHNYYQLESYGACGSGGC